MRSPNIFKRRRPGLGRWVKAETEYDYPWKQVDEAESYSTCSETSDVSLSLDGCASSSRSPALRQSAAAAHSTGTTNERFWRSRQAKAVYGSLLLTILLRNPLPFYALAYLVLASVFHLLKKWFRFFADDDLNRSAVKCLRALCRRILQEGERAVNGDYSRQVMAGYLLYNCTAPGESYVGACIRYRMSMINQRVIEEMEEWQMRRLGYQKSKRDIFN